MIYMRGFVEGGYWGEFPQTVTRMVNYRNEGIGGSTEHLIMIVYKSEGLCDLIRRLSQI